MSTGWNALTAIIYSKQQPPRERVKDHNPPCTCCFLPYCWCNTSKTELRAPWNVHNCSVYFPFTLIFISFIIVSLLPFPIPILLNPCPYPHPVSVKSSRIFRPVRDKIVSIRRRGDIRLRLPLLPRVEWRCPSKLTRRLGTVAPKSRSMLSFPWCTTSRWHNSPASSCSVRCDSWRHLKLRVLEDLDSGFIIGHARR